MIKDNKPHLQDVFDEVEPGHFEVDWIYHDLMVVTRVAAGLIMAGVIGYVALPSWKGVLAGLMCYALGYHAMWTNVRNARGVKK